MSRSKVTTWNKDDLVSRVDRSLDFAEAAISLVSHGDTGIDLEALEAPPDKIIAETAMLLRSIGTLPGKSADALRQRARRLSEQLVEHARHARVRVGVALFPALALDYGAAHIVLGSAGFQDDVFTDTIKASLSSTTAHARERFPHRELEQAWLSSLLHDSVLTPELFARTSLAHGIDLISGSRDDAYALTHALMYATDFGNAKPHPSIEATRIISMSRSALAGVLDDDDFDLAGELLLSWPFLGKKWDDTASFAFSVLATVEDEVGVLPSLALDLLEYKKLPVGSRANYVAAVAYHTAYVMGLLCASCLRANCRPRVMQSTGAASTNFAASLIRKLKMEKRTPQWLRYADTLADDRLNACTPFFLDVAIRRHVRKMEFGETHALICEAAKHGIRPSSLFVQSAEILNRLARFAQPAHAAVA